VGRTKEVCYIRLVVTIASEERARSILSFVCMYYHSTSSANGGGNREREREDDAPVLTRRVKIASKKRRFKP